MFVPYKNADGACEPYEYIAAGDVGYGQAAAMDMGMLKGVSGGVKPAYIVMGEEKIERGGEELVPAIRVDPMTVFKTELSVDGTTLAIGNKVTIAADGKKVTATTSAGVAEIVAMFGNEAGDEVLVRFA